MARSQSLILTLMQVSILVLVMAVPTSSNAELEQALLDDGWDEIIFDDLPANIFTANDDVMGLAREVQVNSESSVSIAFLNVDVDLGVTQNLSWSWQSQTPIIDTDTTQRGGDDRTLAVYVAFPYQPDQASFGYRLQRTAVELLHGADTPDRILIYIWGGGGKRGTVVANPYTADNGKIIFLRTPDDAVGEWFTETVNVRQDFIDAFGFEPVSPIYVGIGADSDDTNSVIRAKLRGLQFSE